MKWYNIIRHLAHRAPSVENTVEDTSDTTNVSDATEVVSEETPSEGVTIISADIDEYVEEEAPEDYESTVLTNEEISEVVASLAAIQSYFSEKNGCANISKVIHADFVGNISRDMYEIFHELHVKYGDVHLMNPVLYLYILQQTDFRKSMSFIMNELFELYASGQDKDLDKISRDAIEMDDEEYCQDEDPIDDEEETEHEEKPYIKFVDKADVPVEISDPRNIEPNTFRSYLPSEEENTDEEESNEFDCPVVNPDDDDIINDPLDNIVNVMTENGLTVEGE